MQLCKGFLDERNALRIEIRLFEKVLIEIAHSYADLVSLKNSKCFYVLRQFTFRSLLTNGKSNLFYFNERSISPNSFSFNSIEDSVETSSSKTTGLTLTTIHNRIEHLLLASELKGSPPYAFFSGPQFGAHSISVL